MRTRKAKEVELVPFPEDLWSEDSSFYGDDETKAKFEAEVKAFNPREWWDVHAWNFQSLIAWDKAQVNGGAQSAKRPAEETTKSPAKKVKLSSTGNSHKSDDSAKTQPASTTRRRRDDPHNPYEDLHTAYQLNETVSEFVARLPPSTTNVSTGPWLWVADPYSTAHESSGDVGSFKQLGYGLLEEFTSRKQKMEEASSGKAAGLITRKLKPDRDWLEQSILSLAKEKKVTHGKWMLFVFPNKVDAVWKTVVQGTIEGKLGSSAKVATDDGGTDRAQRLICVYTEDFSDVQDVKRVLQGLYELDLVVDPADGDGRPVYYKTDAYSLLDIVSANEYKIAASMYNSRDMFKEMAKEMAKERR